MTFCDWENPPPILEEIPKLKFFWGLNEKLFRWTDVEQMFHQMLLLWLGLIDSSPAQCSRSDLFIKTLELYFPTRLRATILSQISRLNRLCQGVEKITLKRMEHMISISGIICHNWNQNCLIPAVTSSFAGFGRSGCEIFIFWVKCRNLSLRKVSGKSGKST